MKIIILLLTVLFISNGSFSQKKPDLIIKEIKEPVLSYKEGYKTTLTIVIKNTGKKKSEAVMLKVWDDDSNKWNDDSDGQTDFVVYKEIPPLRRGQSIEIEIDVVYWIYNNNCEVGAFIDCKETLEESKEDNNILLLFLAG